MAGFKADLGGGELSATDQALVETAAGVKLRIEHLTHKMKAGEDVNSDEVVRLASTVKRLLGAISAKADKRKPDGQDALQAYLASSTFQVPADDADHDVESTEPGDTADTLTEPTTVT